jgi:3-oxoacyl-[acyl-carrier-protein] synthase III
MGLRAGSMALKDAGLLGNNLDLITMTSSLVWG